MAANTVTELMEKVFGLSWHTNAKEIAKRLGYTTYAGDPTNNLTPEFIGQECLDTSNSAWYKAHSEANSGWKKLTP